MHVAHQFDAAVFTRDQRLRPDHTGVVDSAWQQAAGRPGSHQDLTAIGLDQAAVLHQRVHRALIHAHLEQAVASHVQRDGVARRECHCAQLGGNHTVVAHIGTQQRHVAAIGGVDRALVVHPTGARAVELVAAGHEVTVGHVQAGGHQATHIDRCALAKQDTVRVHQEHLTVGAQAAQNAGRVRAQYPVQGHRAAGGLHKLHGLTGGDAETLPVDDRVLAELMDGGAARPVADGGGTSGHHTATGLGQRVASKRQHHRHRQCLQTEPGAKTSRVHARRCFFAAAAGVFGHSDKGAGAVIPERSVRAVHYEIQ